MNKIVGLAFSLLAFFCFLTQEPLHGVDIHVAPPATIQSAIAQAVNGDRVLVAPGNYVEQIDFLGKAISVIGLGGAQQNVIDGGGTGPVVRFQSGEGAKSILQGFTVTGGFASQGAGGIQAATGASPTVLDCMIRDNGGKFGGGISGSPNLRRCVVWNNRASLTHGGGIYGAPKMKYCVVAENTATSANGGGLYVTGGTTIEDCIIIGNSAVLANSKGGGIYVKTSESVTLSRCVVANNSATGGVFAGAGGGVFANSGVTVLNCAVIGNQLSGSSILGGGIYGGATILNTIVFGNTGPQLSSVGSVTYSNIEGGFAGLGNINNDSLFVQGSIHDYHLKQDSPCIDAGDPGLVDPDGSRSDMGAFPFQTLYTRSNVLAPHWEEPSWPEISVAVGGRQALRILAGNDAGNLPYLTVGSLSGTSPGVVVLGTPVPVNFDAYFTLTLIHPNTPPLAGSLGILDGTGNGETVFRLLPDINSAFGGLEFHHASMVKAHAVPALFLVTNAARLGLVP